MSEQRVIDLTEALADSLNDRDPADVVVVNGVRYRREGAVPEGAVKARLYRTKDGKINVVMGDNLGEIPDGSSWWTIVPTDQQEADSDG